MSIRIDQASAMASSLLAQKRVPFAGAVNKAAEALGNPQQVDAINKEQEPKQTTNNPFMQKLLGNGSQGTSFKGLQETQGMKMPTASPVGGVNQSIFLAGTGSKGGAQQNQTSPINFGHHTGNKLGKDAICENGAVKGKNLFLNA